MMEKIKLITDSGSDIPVEKLEGYELEMIPVPLYHDTVPCAENVDCSTQELFELLNNNEKLRIGHVPAAVYLDRFKQAFAQGYHSVIVVTPAHDFAGMFAAALSATDMFLDQTPDAKGVMDIMVIDSGTYSIGYGYPVMLACEMLNQGATSEELVQFLKARFEHTKMFVTAFSMRGVFSNGIFEAVKLMAIEVTKSFPICCIDNGNITALESERGEQRTFGGFMEHCRRALSANPHGEYLIFYADLEEKAHTMGDMLSTALEKEPAGYYKISAATAVSMGTSCIGVVFNAKREAPEA